MAPILDRGFVVTPFLSLSLFPSQPRRFFLQHSKWLPQGVKKYVRRKKERGERKRK